MFQVSIQMSVNSSIGSNQNCRGSVGRFSMISTILACKLLLFICFHWNIFILKLNWVYYWFHKKVSTNAEKERCHFLIIAKEWNKNDFNIFYVFVNFVWSNELFTITFRTLVWKLCILRSLSLRSALIFQVAYFGTWNIWINILATFKIQLVFPTNKSYFIDIHWMLLFICSKTN